MPVTLFNSYKSYNLNYSKLSSNFFKVFSRLINLLSTKTIFFHKFLVKLNWIKFNIHALLFWNYFLVSNFRYFFVAKLYFIKVIKTVTLFNLYLSVYRALAPDQKSLLFKFHRWFHPGKWDPVRWNKWNQHKMSSYFIKRKKLKVFKKSRRFSMSFPLRLPLRLITFNSNINFSLLNHYFSFYFKSIKQRVFVSSKFFHFISSFSPVTHVFRYSKMKQLLFPIKMSVGYSSKVFYKRISEITVSDIYIFFFRFISLNIKKGYKLFPLKLLREVSYWSFVEKVDLFSLFRHMLFVYTPWVYVKSNVRGKPKPIILDKFKALNLMAKWWLDAAIVRRERSIALGLFLELLDIKDNRGLFVSKARDTIDTALNSYSRKGRPRKLKKILSKRKIKLMSKKKRLSLKRKRNPVKRLIFRVKVKIIRNFKRYFYKRKYFRSLSSLNSFGFLNPFDRLVFYRSLFHPTMFDRLLLKRIFRRPLSRTTYKNSSKKKRKLFSFFYYIKRSSSSSVISVIKKPIKNKPLR